MGGMHAHVVDHREDLQLRRVVLPRLGKSVGCIHGKSAKRSEIMLIKGFRLGGGAGGVLSL